MKCGICEKEVMIPCYLTGLGLGPYRTYKDVPIIECKNCPEDKIFSMSEDSDDFMSYIKRAHASFEEEESKRLANYVLWKDIYKAFNVSEDKKKDDILPYDNSAEWKMRTTEGDPFSDDPGLCGLPGFETDESDPFWKAGVCPAHDHDFDAMMAGKPNRGILATAGNFIAGALIVGAKGLLAVVAAIPYALIGGVGGAAREKQIQIQTGQNKIKMTDEDFN